MGASRRAAIALVAILLAAYAAAIVATVATRGGARAVLLAGIGVAAVAVATLLVMWAWPRLTSGGEGRSPHLVRCPRCASMFTPPLRASEATCPTCGLEARFPGVAEPVDK